MNVWTWTSRAGAVRPGGAAARAAAVALWSLALAGALEARPVACPLPGNGDVVAVIEVQAPEAAPFVVRATVPVPAGTYPRPDGLVPFSVRDVSGALAPTQVEVVSRYPVSADGADVVEVLGYVDLPAGTPPGKRVTYQVVENPHAQAALTLPPAIRAFLTTPGSAVLVARDCFGNRYQLDLLAELLDPGSPYVTVLRRGAAAYQVRTYGVLEPVPGTPIGAPTGALPHLMGVHAYITAWRDTDALSVDLRVHNGFDGYDKSSPLDDPLGKVYFQDLELVLPAYWSVMFDLEEPTIGKPYKANGKYRYPIIEPTGDGTLHVLPHQSQLHRRMAVSPVGYEDLDLQLARDQGLGFCRRGASPTGGELYSWWNPATARYFPQRQPLPDLSWYSFQAMENGLATSYWMARQALQSGNPGNTALLPSPALGWAHPWGVAYGGMAGGVEINMYDGLELAEVGSNAGWQYNRLVHRMVMDRQPTSLYDRFGRPTSLDKWVIPTPFPHIDMNFWMKLWAGPDPFGFNAVSQFQVQHVQSKGLAPAYEAALSKFEPIDFQHHVRMTRTPKVLAWLGNDALAKDDLLHAAEIVRMSFHGYTDPYGKAASGSGLYSLQAAAKAHPHNGIAWGRGQAWSLDTVVAAYALQDDAYRAKVRPWLQQCADVIADGQISCSGFIQAEVNPNWLGGAWRVRAGGETAFTEHALWGLKETVFRGVDPARLAQTEQVLVESAYSGIGPMAWAPAYNAPYFLVAVGDLDSGQPAYCGAVPPGGTSPFPESFFTWCGYAYGYQLTGDAEFLNKAAIMAGSPGNLLQGIKNAGLANMVNKAALLALLQ